MSLLRAMTTVGGLTGLSRIAGFVRDILTASILGAGPVADAFFVALKLPNFFRRVTAEGAFSVSFVPLYSETLEKEGEAAADKFANNAFSIMLGALSIFSIVIIAIMPWFLYAIAPGFSDDPLRYDMAVELSRITFPYLLLMSLTALLGGVLNAHGKYGPFAFAPVMFNVCMIGALLVSNWFQTTGHALAYGILVSGFIQLFWLILSCRKIGFKVRLQKPVFTTRIKKVFKLMGPGTIGAGVMHINLFADLMIASFLPTGAISYLYYADRLNQLPLGVVGIAVGTALLPMLSRSLAAANMEEARELFNKAMEYCLLLALPAALALMVIPDDLIGGLFQRGEFTAEDTAQSARVLFAYSLGLPAYIAIKIFSSLHWARQDTVTPVKIAVIATLSNIALSIAFIQPFGVMGIALGTGLTGWMQFVMHMKALKEHPAAHFNAKFKARGLRIVFSTVVMVAVLLGAKYFVDIPGGPLVRTMVLVGAGLVSYGICAVATGLLSVRKFKKLIS